MLIWLVKFEEDLPIDKNPYKHRMTMLAESLLRNGHKVTRWASSHNHNLSKSRSKGSKIFDVSENYKIHLIRSLVHYNKRAGIKRLLNIYISSFLMFYKFLKCSKNERPDIIVCSMPSPINCLICAIYSYIFNIKFVIDARDMWPEVFINEAKNYKKILILPLTLLMRVELYISTILADALYGITENFVDYILSFSKRKKSKYDQSFPIGFDRSFSYPEKESEMFWQDKGINFEKKIIYFAGEISSTVFDASDIVKRAMKKAEINNLDSLLVFCGDGIMLDSLKKKMSELKNVIFVNRVEPGYLDYLKRRSTIGLLCISNRIDYESSLSNKI